MPKFSQRGTRPEQFQGLQYRVCNPRGTKISREPKQITKYEFPDFESTASGGSAALFPTSGEQELLSREKLQDPLQTVITPVLGGSQSEAGPGVAKVCDSDPD